MPATSATSSKAFFAFFAAATNSTDETNKSAVNAVNQSIFLRCLWVEHSTPNLNIEGSNLATDTREKENGIKFG